MTSETEPAGAIKLFYSYAPEDEKYRKRLEKQMSLLKQQGLIADWHDQQISAGKEWSKEINTYLNEAQIILLLVSPDYLASDYCYSSEVKRAIERHNAGEARVIPVILRPVEWHDTPFHKLRALPTDGKPATRWRNLDEAFLDIGQGIRKAIKEISKGHGSSQSVVEASSSKVVMQPKEPKAPAALPETGPVRITSKKHILVVDDEPAIALFMRLLIEDEFDYYVTIIGDGKEALSFIKNIHVDLIFLDILMPKFGGLEVINQLRATNNKVPMIAMSSNPKYEEEAVELGANVFMHKPSDADDIIFLINKYLN